MNRKLTLSISKDFDGQLRQHPELPDKASYKIISDILHEFRQPLYAQTMFLEIINSEILSNRSREALDYIFTAAENIEQVLNILCDFSRIESGIVEPCARSFLMQPLLNKIKGEYASLAAKYGLEYRSRETAVEIETDPTLFEMIVRSLVANVIRNTLHGGVLVACRLRGNQTVLEVWSSGNKKNTAHLHSISHHSPPMEAPIAHSRNSFRFELSIAQHFAQRLGLDLTSTALPQGNVYRLSLPISGE